MNTPTIHIGIREEYARDLAAYASIPIAFDVTEVLAPGAMGIGVAPDRLEARPIARPYLKDYDAIPGNGPREWPAQFGVAAWGLLTAFIGGERVGGAAVVVRDSAIDMLKGRDDLAVLWDLRIAPNLRRSGIGSRLLGAAEHWARARRARTLEVETQDIHVPACRLYASHGFVLHRIDEHAYPEFPGETRLIWSKRLSPAPSGD